MKEKISTAVAELSTVRDMLRFAMTCFYAGNLHYGHGTDNAWDEALALVLHALHLPPDVNPNILDARLTQNERALIGQLIERRVSERIPVAYLTQEAWFAGLKFHVDPRVLIPRSSLAETIENDFAPWIESSKIERILDLCTGSACIAIACAAAFPDAEIDAVDISEDALAVAQLNVQHHRKSGQVHLIQSDLFAKLKGKRYDVIISNPPYVDAEDMAALPLEYRHEPSLALAAGNDGLAIVNQILKTAAQHLTPYGILLVEVGNSEHALLERYPDVPFTWLEFSRGEQGVFLLTATQLQTYFGDKP
jgi:ribosomal protein L3 glutamine methyltransferase